MINRLPYLSDPERYAGLYIFDFGDHVSVGYTAHEVEFLLADPRYAGGTVYRIYRAYPDGTLEIRGVDPRAWHLTTGIVFWFGDRQEAIDSYQQLKRSAETTGPPGEFLAFVIEKQGQDFRYAIVMRYRQELDQAIAHWLLRIDFSEGEMVQAGSKLVHEVLQDSAELLAEQFGADVFSQTRTLQEVLEKVDREVQR